MTQPVPTATRQEHREAEHSTGKERQEAELRIGLKLRPRDTAFVDDPGHMGVTWKEDRERGFRGEILELPDAFRVALLPFLE